MKINNIKELKNKTIVEISGLRNGGNIVELRCDDGSLYTLQNVHYSREDVYIDDIKGNTDDLLNSPITKVKRTSVTMYVSPYGGGKEYKVVWSIFKFGTQKGKVEISWRGEAHRKSSAKVRLIQILE
jgi:hypothetical protein